MKFKRCIIFCFCVSIVIDINAQDSLFTNSLGMQFVLIKPGTFVLGKFQPPYPKSSANNGYRSVDLKKAKELAIKDSRKGFTVKIKKPFYIGRFEVTQEQWEKVMGNNPSVFKGENHPVENVTWFLVKIFLEELNKLDKNFVYRLPTEFEWEYAARAGAKNDISWDEIRASAQMGLNTTAEVGQKKPNAWGLYDMLGNVWEWVQDYYNGKQFADSVPKKSGDENVLKGASFVGDVKNATYMTHAGGPGNGWDVGFRIVAELKADHSTIPEGNEREVRLDEIIYLELPVNNSDKTVPPGFKRIFNGKDLKGWHISRTTHQGTTPDFKVSNGIITGKEFPYGQGGVLLTNKMYKDFELYLEVKIDSFCNGGIFLRSTESGQAYQIELSEPGGTGSLFGEMLPISKSAEATNKSKVWRANGWNSFRVRMVGDTPTITLWINEVKMYEVTQPKNDFIAGATKGMIGLQVHWSATFDDASKAFDMSGSWRPGAAHRFRNLAIKEIK